MTLHDALFPWATPRKLALFLSALAACLIFGDSTYGDVALAIDPVTLGLIIAAGAAAKGVGNVVKGYQAKKGVEAIADSKGFKTTQTLGKEAGERLKTGAYSGSDAGKRHQLGEIVRTQDAATRGSRENAERSIKAQGGYGRSGRALAALRDVVTGGRAETVAKGTESIEKADLQRAVAERNADLGAHGTATAQRAQLETALASAKGQMYGGGPSAAGDAAIGYGQSQISAGAYEKKPGEESYMDRAKVLG